MDFAKRLGVLPPWAWVTGFVLLVVVTVGIVRLSFYESPPHAISYSDGLSPAEPSSAQMVAMATAFEQQFGSSVAAGAQSPPRIGCAAYSMATRAAAGGQLVSYAQVDCETCQTFFSGVIPAVFRLTGQKVISVKADDAIAEPDFYRQIKELFPRQLWSAAHSQQVPDFNTLRVLARHRAGC